MPSRETARSRRDEAGMPVVSRHERQAFTLLPAMPEPPQVHQGGEGRLGVLRLRVDVRHPRFRIAGVRQDKA